MLLVYNLEKWESWSWELKIDSRTYVKSHWEVMTRTILFLSLRENAATKGTTKPCLQRGCLSPFAQRWAAQVTEEAASSIPNAMLRAHRHQHPSPPPPPEGIGPPPHALLVKRHKSRVPLVGAQVRWHSTLSMNSLSRSEDWYPWGSMIWLVEMGTQSRLISSYHHWPHKEWKLGDWRHQNNIRHRLHQPQINPSIHHTPQNLTNKSWTWTKEKQTEQLITHQSLQPKHIISTHTH